MSDAPESGAGVVLQAAGGLFRVAVPGGGELLCRARGRLRGRRSTWRDERDAEATEAALDPEEEPEEEPEEDGDGDAVPEAETRRPGRAAEPARENRRARADRAPEPAAAAGAAVPAAAERPLPGDRVEWTALGGGEGVIGRVLPRHSLLVRPPVANADTVVVVVCWEAPPFSAAFVDRVLLSAALEGCGAVVCVNKADMLSPQARDEVRGALRPWGDAGYGTVLCSAAHGDGVEDLRALLRGHLAVLAGPSGSGKSRLLSSLVPGGLRRSGALSRRAGRGRHTTRSVELLRLPGGGDGYVADTPGFSRLTLDRADPEDLPLLYPEFAPHTPGCRFRGCLHDAEPECAVRAAVAAGTVAAGRYDRYRALLAELRARPPRW